MALYYCSVTLQYLLTTELDNFQKLYHELSLKNTLHSLFKKKYDKLVVYLLLEIFLLS